MNLAGIIRNFHFSFHSLALYTRRGIPAHNYFLWPDLRLGTGSRLCQCEPPTAGRGLPMRFCQTRLRPLLTLDRFPGHGLIYPAGGFGPGVAFFFVAFFFISPKIVHSDLPLAPCTSGACPLPI